MMPNLNDLMQFCTIVAPDALTALYARLSVDDANDGDSNSIVHQKEMLERYCQDNGYTNYKFYVDDGFSGTNFERPDFKRMIADVEAGKVKRVIVKDLSRFGRDYLQVGMFTEVLFAQYDIHFIAIANNVDSQKGENDLTPFVNLFNEWYARDCSRKQRAVKRAKGISGKRIASIAPYGYISGEDGKLIPDEETAWVVKLIYDLCIQGYGTTQIANELTRRNIPTPGTLAFRRTGSKRNYCPGKEFVWVYRSIDKILSYKEYLGHTVNFKTYSKSYKLKKRYEIPEEQQIVFENTHEAIINQEDWDTVQRIRAHRRHPVKQGEPALFSGMLFCADCGSLLRVHRGKTISKHQECYCCGRYRDRTNACSMHYIRELVLADLMKENLKQVVRLASEDEQEFVRRLTNRNAQEQAAQERTLKNELATKEQRIKDLDGIIKRLYEDNITGKLSDERFKIFSTDYEDEQHSLREEVASLKQQLEDMESTSVNVSGFLKAAQRYTDFDELTPSMLHDLIEKIIVHEGDKSSGHREQRIEIYYTFIGAAEGSQIIVKRKRKAA